VRESLPVDGNRRRDVLQRRAARIENDRFFLVAPSAAALSFTQITASAIACASRSSCFARRCSRSLNRISASDCR
jgi:hypothetical protein